MKKAIFILILAGLVAACGNSRKAAPQGTATESAVSATAPVTELPIPVLPDNLTSPEERADYMALHFWDAMKWGDAAMALDSAFMEQNFANYVTILPYATPAGRDEAVGSLLSAARLAGENRLDFIYDVAVRYLYDHESPMHDEELFLTFVDWAEANGYYPEVAAERRADIMKNRRGSEAADFEFELRDGSRSRLSDLRGTPVLLMFYEPDCENCLAAEKELAASPRLAQAVADGSLKMLAVYIGNDRALWSSHAATLPEGWTVGIDTAKRIDRDALYNIGATPSFYLIDPAGAVLLKDAPLAVVYSALASSS